jgi:hypothetical protein
MPAYAFETRPAMSTITNPINTLQLASAVGALGGGRYAWSVPAGWEQGRGAYGGLVLAAMTRAIEDTSRGDGDGATRLARALSASLNAPVAAAACEIQVERLRQGNAVTTWAARLVQDGEVKATASLVAGRERPTGHHLTSPPPSAPPWTEVPISAAIKPPLAPVFVQHFEVRALPPYPFSGASAASALAWVQPKVPFLRVGTPELTAMSDVCWPSSFAIERAPRPMATIAYHCAFAWPADGIPADEPLLHRGTLIHGADGYFTEIRELWTPRGELVCHNPQVFAWIK